MMDNKTKEEYVNYIFDNINDTINLKKVYGKMVNTSDNRYNNAVIIKYKTKNNRVDRTHRDTFCEIILYPSPKKNCITIFLSKTLNNWIQQGEKNLPKLIFEEKNNLKYMYQFSLDQRDFAINIINMLINRYADEFGKGIVKDDNDLITGNKTEEISKNKDNEIREAKKIDDEISQLNLKGKEREAVVKIRVNQGVFRDRLLERYGKCCLCGVHSKGLLIASHIKPWSKSEDDEKLDVNNGFLFCANHDKLFDNGLITFDDDGNIIISNELDDADRMFMNIREDMKIELTDENKKYLEYNRKMFNKKQV